MGELDMAAKKLRKQAKKTPRKIAQSFERWKASVQRIVRDEFGYDDIWAENDPYDLVDSAETDFVSGKTPRSFVDEMFSEDQVRSKMNDDAVSGADADDGYGEIWQ